MKSITKTTVMLSSLLLLTGCWDFGWSKKDNQEKGEIATHENVAKKVSTCSHKGCTHDHSNDTHKKHTKQQAHQNDVKTQSMDDDDMDDSNMNDETMYIIDEIDNNEDDAA